MQNQVYVCAELGKTILGNYECKKWVVYNDLPAWGLAVSQQDAKILGGYLIVFFSLIVGYLAIVKAIREA